MNLESRSRFREHAINNWRVGICRLCESRAHINKVDYCVDCIFAGMDGTLLERIPKHHPATIKIPCTVRDAKTKVILLGPGS